MFPHIDLTQFIGLTGIPFIEQIVEYLKDNWKLPVRLSPLVALVLGVAINCGLAAYLHEGVYNAVGVGLYAGLGASIWHEAAKSPKN